MPKKKDSSKLLDVLYHRYFDRLFKLSGLYGPLCFSIFGPNSSSDYRMKRLLHLHFDYDGAKLKVGGKRRYPVEVDANESRRSF